MTLILASIVTCAALAATPCGSVDLGLSSGNLWSTHNLEGRYAWGDTQAKDDFSNTTYTVNGYDWFKDKKIVLDRDDDAAALALGEGWQIPGREDWEELLFECKWEACECGCGYAYKVTGPNGNHIHITRYKGYSYYWSRDIYGATGAVALCLEEDSRQLLGIDRWQGLCIRPVYKEPKIEEPEPVIYLRALRSTVVLREFPTTNSKPMAKISLIDTTAVVVGEYDKWWEVEFDDEHGYVLKSESEIYNQ